MDKAQLRLQLQNRLLAIPPQQRSEKSRQACKILISMPQFQNASTVMMYLSLPHEVDTSEAILSSWQSNKIVVVPKVSWKQRHMIAVQIHSLETGLSTSASGLRTPIAGAPVPFEEIDVVITPALGFDNKGNRLGRGGSYYDRFFANKELKATRIGLAFNEQLIDSIPKDEHDEPVDFLVTDEKIICINEKSRR